MKRTSEENRKVPFYDLRRKISKDSNEYEDINFWIVQLKPIKPSDRGDREIAFALQEQFLEEGIFAMGWALDEHAEKYLEELKRHEENGIIPLNNHTKKVYLELYKKLLEDRVKRIREETSKTGAKSNDLVNEIINVEGDIDIVSRELDLINGVPGAKKWGKGSKPGVLGALDAYAKVKPGDYVITRLRNGHYLIGKVSEGPQFLGKANDDDPQYKKIGSRISWGCKVEDVGGEKWREISNPENVPAEVRGIFFQNNQSTIDIVSPNNVEKTTLRLSIQKLYEDWKQSKDKSTSIVNTLDKFELSKRNFARYLDPIELEDLVALHIHLRHGALSQVSSIDTNLFGYMLRPSSGKASEPEYEFRFTNILDRSFDDITCQVKNQQVLIVDPYFKAVNDYARIYLFSGLGQYQIAGEIFDEDVAQDKIRKKLKSFDCSNAECIQIISQADLYQDLSLHRIFDEAFYTCANETKKVEAITIEEICDALEGLRDIDGNRIYITGICQTKNGLSSRRPQQKSNAAKTTILFGEASKKGNDGKEEVQLHRDGNLYFVKSNGLFYSTQLEALVCTHCAPVPASPTGTKAADPDYLDSEIERIRTDLGNVIFGRQSFTANFQQQN